MAIDVERRTQLWSSALDDASQEAPYRIVTMVAARIMVDHHRDVANEIRSMHRMLQCSARRSNIGASYTRVSMANR